MSFKMDYSFCYKFKVLNTTSQFHFSWTTFYDQKLWKKGNWCCICFYACQTSVHMHLIDDTEKVNVEDGSSEHKTGWNKNFLLRELIVQIQVLVFSFANIMKDLKIRLPVSIFFWGNCKVKNVYLKLFRIRKVLSLWYKI